MFALSVLRVKFGPLAVIHRSTVVEAIPHYDSILRRSPCIHTSGSYWRFEDSPGFTHDSAGTAHLINSGATQYTLPGSGDGLGIHPVELLAHGAQFIFGEHDASHEVTERMKLLNVLIRNRVHVRLPFWVIGSCRF